MAESNASKLKKAEEELAELKKQLAEKPETGGDQQNNTASAELVEENNSLKEQLKQTKEEKEASEERMMAEINRMDEEGVTIVNGEVVGTGILVMTPDEYREYGAKNGTIFGRIKGQVTKCSIEELRALINSNWTPSMIMEKHGMNAEALKQLVWKLSKKELRDTPVKFDIKRDMFHREG